MIDAIHLAILRNAEYLQFVKDLITIVDKNDPEALKVVAENNALKTKISELEALFKTQLSNPITKELEVLDGRRDKCINGILNVVNGYTYHFKESISQAAYALSDNLKLYGVGIAEQNYQSETTILTNIINDWETKSELVAAVNLLQLADWKNELKTVNLEFSSKYIDRTQEYGTASPENIKSKREQTNAVYYELRDRIGAYGIIEKSNPNFTKVINELNALIAQYNSLLKNRSSNSGN